MLRNFARNCKPLATSCPKCGLNAGFISHGTYKRIVVTKDGEEQQTVTRLKCRACGKTHSVLPHNTAPYTQFSIEFIHAVFSDWSSKTLTVQKLCKKYQIGCTTLYRILRNAKEQSIPHNLAIDQAFPALIPFKGQSCIQPMFPPRKPVETWMYRFLITTKGAGMDSEIEVAITELTNLMRENGYSERTISDHSRAWKRFLSFANAQNAPEISEQLVNQWRDYEGLIDAPLACNQSRPLRSVRMLLCFAKTQTVDIRAGKNLYEAPDYLKPLLSEYRDNLENRKLKDITIKCRIYQIRKFLWWVGKKIKKIEHLTPEHVFNYVNYLQKTSAATSVDRARTTITEFLSLIEDTHNMDHRISILVRGKHAKAEACLPSVYSPEEIALLIKTISKSGKTPKRNTAMVLLAAQYGMRKRDINTLTFDEINWHVGTITKKQSKTAEVVEYPLTKEIKLALIDYIKNERPKVDERLIFLHATAPFTPFLPSSNPLHPVMKRAFNQAGIDISKRKHGPHALRHSLATQMLDAGVPYQTIACLVGHKSKNMARRYLAIDQKKLKSVALEVPPCAMK